MRRRPRPLSRGRYRVPISPQSRVPSSPQCRAPSSPPSSSPSSPPLPSPSSDTSVNSPCEASLPACFPSNTKVYIQKPDGEVYSGPLTYLLDHPIPPWVLNPNEGADVVENVYVQLLDGNGLISNIRVHEHRINMNDQMYEEHHCFISYGDGHILVAVLRRYENSPRRRIPFGPIIMVRMPLENTRYIGVIYDFQGRRPSWIE